MAKKSYRRSAQSQRDNVGCMWGLISLFDFRRGHPTKKLLSNKKHGTPRNAGTGYSKIKLDSLRNFQNKHGGSLVDEIREDQVNLVVTSVKTLMEEEMSQYPQQTIANDEAQRGTSNLQNEVHPKKNNKKRSKKLNVMSDSQANNLADSAGLDNHQSDSMDLSKRSSLDFDLAAFLIELYSYTCQEIHAGSHNKFYFLPASGSIGPKIHDHLDELDDHLDQKISFFQRTLGDVAQAIISQKSTLENQLDGRCIVHSKEFMDALDTLNSDNKLFLKLLQDPDSLLLEHIRSLQSTQVGKLSKLESDKCLENVQLLREKNNSRGKCKESDSDQLVHKQNRHISFWKKDKSSKLSNESPTSKALNRIVVLKPSSARNQNSSVIITPRSSPQSHHVLMHDEGTERIVSHFSLKEIKRRLQQMIGENRKVRHAISMDGILHKVPVRSNDSRDACKLMNSESVVASSASNSSCDNKKLSESLSISKRKGEKINSEECEVNINNHISSSRFKSLIYEEAKKHLAEMLDTRVDSLPTVQVSESLERVLSLPRYNELCPRSSPLRDKDLTMPSEETGDPSLQQFKLEDATNTLSLSRPNFEFSSCSQSIPSDELKLFVLNTESVDANMQEIPCIREDLNNKGSRGILGAVDNEAIVGSNQLVLPLESSRNELIVMNEMCEEEESDTPRGLGSSEKTLLTETQSKFPPTSFLGENLMASESTTEKPEQPSPVSVLETFLSEDITSPKSLKTEHHAIQKQHQHVDYEDCDNHLRIIASPDVLDGLRDCLDDNQARFNYIKAVLEASGLTNELSEKWDMPDQLLESSLFDEVEVFFSFLQDDAKLLFDCINEVLVEIHERFLKCTPWLSFIKQNVLPAPRGESLIQQVRKGIEWHLHIQLPNTLDRVIRKDLDGKSWLNLQFETENATNEICETILDDLMEETVYDLWF